MKTAKVKAQELYPDESGFDGFAFDSRNKKSHFSERQAYIKGYDQAFQDFLEKAEEFLYLQLNNGSIECGNIKRLIEQFKNYIIWQQ